MSEQTTNLSMPYIQAAQAQKHVTHNEAIELLDAIVQLTLEAVDGTIPPASAAEGQAWAIGSGASGVWAGKAGQIAAWRGGGWLFIAPQIGWRAYDKSEQKMQVFTQTGWEIPTAELPDLNNLTEVGINASADATNRLAVSANTTLLNHEGAGHQLKINKAGTTDTASLLFQSNWSGRAEMGIAGNDDFSVKVSDDGSTFIEALRIDASTGQVALPTTGLRQLMPYNYRFNLETDKAWSGHSRNNSTTVANSLAGTASEPSIDWQAKGIFLPAGTKITSFTRSGNAISDDVVDLDWRCFFQYGPWGNGWTDETTTIRSTLSSQNGFSFLGTGGLYNETIPLNYTTPADGFFLGTARVGALTTLSSSSFLFIAGVLDVILPPSI